jgi:hypothetical protein
MLADQLERMIRPLLRSQGVSPVHDDLGHALVVVLVAVVALVALMVVVAYIEPRKPRAVLPHEPTETVVNLSPSPRHD